MDVICFGDSNTYGYDPASSFGGRYPPGETWVDILADKTGWKVDNRGQNGREIPLDPVAFPSGTDFLIIMLGTNDLLQGCGPAGTSDRMARFLTSLDFPHGDILLIAPPPMVPGSWVPDTELISASHTLADMYRHLSQRLGVSFADAGQWDVPLSFDGVHFTREGHRAFAAGLLNSLATLGTFSGI